MIQIIQRTLPKALARLCLPVIAATLVLSVLVSPVYADDNRNFEVHLVIDGNVTSVEATFGYSVLCVLDLAGFTLSEEHRTAMAVLRPVSPDQVIRVAFSPGTTQTVREEIPYQTIRIPHSLFASGRTIPVSSGSPGLRDATYSLLSINEEAIGMALVSEAVIEDPKHARVIVGTPGARISPLNFNWERDGEGSPINYVRRLTNQRATAYSERCGTITSTGQRARVGLVAVNPRVIPYGTLLYIRSACGTFNYGYAIAADTGGDLMRGVIDIDLFYDSHFEAIQHGSRRVEIFILQLPS